MISATRKSGLRAFAVGAIVSVIGGWLGVTYDLWRFKPFGWLYALPIALAMIGLGQAGTGVPFRDLAAQWDSLKGWQRGVLGVTILAVFSALLFGVLAAAIMSGVV
ncbi:hypothetical protein [Marilutibacter spongiae]|uniref:Uncharacterized protein n=1 Tax=Marilutibacter spongiae TaxID=2025720 RepID=A0A7W3TNF4_9GAMM|nr:hypothetical protein [Lysobacter spongiae]MBB1061284.1 hypothetical protein [Lysobacter spongiae]